MQFCKNKKNFLIFHPYFDSVISRITLTLIAFTAGNEKGIDASNVTANIDPFKALSRDNQWKTRLSLTFSTGRIMRGTFSILTELLSSPNHLSSGVVKSLTKK